MKGIYRLTDGVKTRTQFSDSIDPEIVELQGLYLDGKYWLVTRVVHLTDYFGNSKIEVSALRDPMPTFPLDKGYEWHE